MGLVVDESEVLVSAIFFSSILQRRVAGICIRETAASQKFAHGSYKTTDFFRVSAKFPC